jgi:maltose alpha-D-glucosyltransferase/alpha-amylase
VEQSNSSILYDNRFFLKVYRKVDSGINPDSETLQFLSERRNFEHVPKFLGTLEHRGFRAEPRLLGLLSANVPNEGDAWNYTLDAVAGFYERILERKPEGVDAAVLAELTAGMYPERVVLLGQITGRMHLALASDRDDPSFAPEPLTIQDLRSVYQSFRGTTRRMIELVRNKIRQIPKPRRAELVHLVGQEQPILQRQSKLLRRMDAVKMRIHGDFHLGQVLNTGKDFVIIDFEGEPTRTLGDRRMKRSPLRDVAGMLRSFHYAAYAALWQQRSFRKEDRAMLEPWAEGWARQIGTIFLDAYLDTTHGAPLVPRDRETLRLMLDAYLLEKAAQEITYELSYRPDWVFLPARGIRSILEGASGMA